MKLTDAEAALLAEVLGSNVAHHVKTRKLSMAERRAFERVILFSLIGYDTRTRGRLNRLRETLLGLPRGSCQ